MEGEDEIMYENDDNEVVKRNNEKSRSQRYATRAGEVIDSPSKDTAKKSKNMANKKVQPDEADTRPTKRIKTEH